MTIPDDWDNPACNKEFIKEFGRKLNDHALKEADQNSTSDIYEDTYT